MLPGAATSSTCEQPARRLGPVATRPQSTLTSAESHALCALSQWLRQQFGGRLREVKLFGSRARGEGHEESDLDVAIVVDELTAAEAREVGYQAGDLLTEYDVVLSPFVVSAARMAQLLSRERAIALAIAAEGIPL